MFDTAIVRAFFGTLSPLAVREVPGCD
jgi:hypothetical protein